MQCIPCWLHISKTIKDDSAATSGSPTSIRKPDYQYSDSIFSLQTSGREPLPLQQEKLASNEGCFPVSHQVSGCKTYQPRKETKLMPRHSVNNWAWGLANESGCSHFKKTSTNIPVTMAVWDWDAWQFLASPELCHSDQGQWQSKECKFYFDFCTSLGSISSVFAA